MLQQLIKNFQNNQLTHALLFHGVPDGKQIINDLSWLLLCEQYNRCGNCRHCQLMQLDSHPDRHVIKAKKFMGVIKIEQVRDIIDIVYTATQCSSVRIILIEFIEFMNQSASNALLKLLEEPPPNVYFIIYSSDLSMITATIISRCQLWHLPMLKAVVDDPHIAAIAVDVLLIFLQKSSVCVIAAKWVKYDFYELLCLIYNLNAQLITELCIHDLRNAVLQPLIPYVSLAKLFIQLDMVQILFDDIKNNVHVNALLAIENVLLHYY